MIQYKSQQAGWQERQAEKLKAYRASKGLKKADTSIYRRPNERQIQASQALKRKQRNMQSGMSRDAAMKAALQEVAQNARKINDPNIKQSLRFGQDLTKALQGYAFRQEPTVATPEKAVVTKGVQPQMEQTDIEKRLEDIAIKKAMKQPLTEDDLRFEYQVNRQAMQQPQMQGIDMQSYLPQQYQNLTAQDIMNMSPEEQLRYKQYADYAQAQAEADMTRQQQDQIGQFYDERLQEAQQEQQQAQEQIQAENDELLQQFKEMRSELDADTIKQIKEAGAEGLTEIQNLMARRGFGRSSATAQALQKATAATQDKIKQIEMATGQAVSEYQVQLLDRLDRKMQKYEERVDKYRDAKDMAKLEQAKTDLEIAQKIFEASPNNPQKMLEFVQTLQQQQMADKQALQEAAVKKFEKALELGYVPTGLSEEEMMTLADNLGIAPEDFVPTMAVMLERSRRKALFENIYYSQDAWGNTTAIIPNYDTGEFESVVVATSGFSPPGMGATATSPLTQGSPVNNYANPNYQTYGSIPEDKLKEIFKIGESGGWCGVRASEISTAPAVGNSWAEKKKKITHFTAPTPGDKILIPYGVNSDNEGNYKGTAPGEYGHVGVVLDFDPTTGDIITIESNADGAINKCLAAGGSQKVCLAKGKNEIKHRNINELNAQFGVGQWGFVAGDFKPEIKQQLDQYAVNTNITVPQGGKTYNDYLQEAVAMNMPPEQAMEYAANKVKQDQEKPQQLFDNANRLATRFKTLTDEITVLEEAFSSIKGFDINTDNAYDDDALIFSFVKVLDPGSVVREGEYEIRRKATNIYNQFAGQYNLAVKGEGMLLPEQRKKIIETMKRLYNNKKEVYSNKAKNAAEVGNSFGIDPSLYLIIPQDYYMGGSTNEPTMVQPIEEVKSGGIILTAPDGTQVYYEDPNDPEIAEARAAGYQ